jgi:hypothetical protein
LGEQGRRRDEIERKTKGATKYLFEEHFGGVPWNNPEKKAKNAIDETVKNAAMSGDSSQFNAAKEFGEIISRYGSSDKAGKPYDEANTFNSLAGFSGDMLGMLNALKDLVDKINDFKFEFVGP